MKTGKIWLFIHSVTMHWRIQGEPLVTPQTGPNSFGVAYGFPKSTYVGGLPMENPGSASGKTGMIAPPPWIRQWLMFSPKSTCIGGLPMEKPGSAADMTRTTLVPWCRLVVEIDHCFGVWVELDHELLGPRCKLLNPAMSGLMQSHKTKQWSIFILPRLKLFISR